MESVALLIQKGRTGLELRPGLDHILARRREAVGRKGD